MEKTEVFVEQSDDDDTVEECEIEVITSSLSSSSSCSTLSAGSRKPSLSENAEQASLTKQHEASGAPETSSNNDQTSDTQPNKLATQAECAAEQIDGPHQRQQQQFEAINRDEDDGRARGSAPSDERQFALLTTTSQMDSPETGQSNSVESRQQDLISAQDLPTTTAITDSGDLQLSNCDSGAVTRVEYLPPNDNNQHLKDEFSMSCSEPESMISGEEAMPVTCGEQSDDGDLSAINSSANCEQGVEAKPQQAAASFVIERLERCGKQLSPAAIETISRPADELHKCRTDVPVCCADLSAPSANDNDDSINNMIEIDLTTKERTQIDENMIGSCCAPIDNSKVDQTDAEICQPLSSARPIGTVCLEPPEESDKANIEEFEPKDDASGKQATDMQPEMADEFVLVPPSTPPTMLWDEDELEREFDEEPEFNARHVIVQRNKNPREHYLLGDELGRGKFGTVFRCTELASGRQLAAKFVYMRRKEDREDVEREVAIMSELQHRRLLQLYDAFDDGAYEMCLITELVEGGELFERIVDDDFDLTERKAAIFMRQICEGVEYMQMKQIVHLDMKPENILCLSRTGNRIKLIDFGLARRLMPEQALRVMFGTPDFAAPEVLMYECVTFATDMWSVGVICYVLLSGLSPFMGDNDLETMANVTRATFDFDHRAFEPISESAKDFIARLLVREPDKRLTASECLKHPWLQRGGPPSATMFGAESSWNSSTSNDNNTESNFLDTTQTFKRKPSDGQAALNMAHLLQVAAEASGQRARASFGAESITGASVSLDKRRLKRYVVRRKWNKTVHAIMALGRMGANLKLKF